MVAHKFFWMRMNILEITVSKVNEYIKNMFDYEPMLSNISVKGEVSNLKYHTSGHIYFTIKDDGGQLSCVMFYGQRAGLGFRMETGQSVIVTGRISVYERDGKYQMYARQIKKAGAGELHEKYEKLKKKLMSEGLFEEGHKKKIPVYANTVGIVTAAGAAALQDIIKVSKRRNPYIQLVLCPVQVQGDAAAKSIADGIKKMDSCKVDVIIVGRGGGSIEDLWAFNEECVARACYECETPIISAVGHETDTTIIDFVSDMRAPTPSAAAELAVFDYHKFVGDCERLRMCLDGYVVRKLEQVKAKAKNLTVLLEHAGPKGRIDSYRQTSDALYDRVRMLMDHKLDESRYKMSLLAARLDGLSPLKKLSQGYSYTQDMNDKNIASVRDVSKGDMIRITVFDGAMDAQVSDIYNFLEETD